MIVWNVIFSELKKRNPEIMKEEHDLFINLKDNGFLFHHVEQTIQILIDEDFFVNFDYLYNRVIKTISEEKTVIEQNRSRTLSDKRILRYATLLYMKWFLTKSDIVALDRL